MCKGGIYFFTWAEILLYTPNHNSVFFINYIAQPKIIESWFAGNCAEEGIC
jgi:hypothetical protein